jgi:hypothetical protein
MSPKPATTPSGEKLLTRYLIFSTDDGGQTLNFVGDQLADGSDAALRAFWPPEAKTHSVAVSENSFKLRPITPKQGPQIGAPVPWPAGPAFNEANPIAETLL